MPKDDNGEIPLFIRRVMLKATETELREATATFDRYMAVVWEIFERISREQAEPDSSTSTPCDKIDGTNDNV